MCKVMAIEPRWTSIVFSACKETLREPGLKGLDHVDELIQMPEEVDVFILRWYPHAFVVESVASEAARAAHDVSYAVADRRLRGRGRIESKHSVDGCLNTRNECGDRGILETAEIRKDTLIDRVRVRRNCRCGWENLAGSNNNAGQRVPGCHGVLELLSAMIGTERLYGLKQWPDEAFRNIGWVKPINLPPNLIAPRPIRATIVCIQDRPWTEQRQAKWRRIGENNHRWEGLEPSDLLHAYLPWRDLFLPGPEVDYPGVTLFGSAERPKSAPQSARLFVSCHC
jgi:hypothetical protein